ncbi:MAG: L,D-transpeptidase [Anaerolineales bacterium]
MAALMIADDQFIQETFEQLSCEDQLAARRWIRRFAVLTPGWYESWSILGLFSNPLASVYYMKRALQINPNSRWARAGLRWAAKRSQESPGGISAPVPTKHSAFSSPTGRKEQPKKVGGYGFLLAAFILAAGCVALGAVWHVRAAENLMGTMPAITPTPFLPVSPTPRPTETATSIPTQEPTATAVVPPTEPAIVVPSIQTSGLKSIVVSLLQQRLYAYEGDTSVYDDVVSTGRGGGTALGNFEILDKISDAYSAPWGFWMPDWMGIYYPSPDMENGIHALPVLADGETIWGTELGTPVSYGCIVLGSEDAYRLFQWADIGTPVSIRG